MLSFRKIIEHIPRNFIAIMIFVCFLEIGVGVVARKGLKKVKTVPFIG